MNVSKDSSWKSFTDFFKGFPEEFLQKSLPKYFQRSPQKTHSRTFLGILLRIFQVNLVKDFERIFGGISKEKLKEKSPKEMPEISLNGIFVRIYGKQFLDNFWGNPCKIFQKKSF